jgi:hypothetical protein
MIKYFATRLEAIDWIAERASDEGQFEVWREVLLFNFLRTGRHFLNLDEKTGEVVLLDAPKKQS